MSCRTGGKGSALTVGFSQSNIAKKRLVFLDGFPTPVGRWIIRLSFSKNEKQVSFMTGVVLAGLKNQSGYHSLKARDAVWVGCVDCTNFRPWFRQRGTRPTLFVGKGRDGEGDGLGVPSKS